MIQALFVDLFGVILGKDTSTIMNYITTISDFGEDKLQDILFGEKYMELERCEISFKQYLHYVQYKIDSDLLDISILEQHLKFFNLVELPVTKILTKCDNKIKLYILTNTNQSHIKKLKNQFTCLDQYSGIITSDLAMAHKPHIEIFKYACKYANVNPLASAFIDDTRSNVEAAQAIGFTAHHYRNIRNLNTFLDQLIC